MANNTIQSYTKAVSIDGANDYLLEYQNSSGVYKSINRNTFLGVTGQPADISTSQTMTNKFLSYPAMTILDNALTLQNASDITKQGLFSLANVTTGTTRTYTLPNASVTLASLTGTETLTNKTITSPTISGGTIDNSTITVDSISGHTTSTIVTVGGVQMNNGTIGTSGAVTSTSIAAGAVIPNSLVASSGSGWAWQTFTPSFTNLTLGNGTAVARYTQIGKMIWISMIITLGSSSVMGSDPQFTPPVAANSFYSTVGNNIVIGFGHLNAGTINALPAPFFNVSTAQIHLGFFTPSSTSNALATVTASLPGTWAATNFYEATMFYEAA